MPDLESIFHHALALDESERSAYLEQACGDDAALKAEIEALLAADRQAATFMAGLENQLHTVLKHHQETGTRIGRYRIDRKIAAGGMGSVYQAWDSKLNRDVALKFLHPHCALAPNAKRRFVREAQAISALNHPNICTVYDVSETESGEQYIVMELCAGKRLDELIAATALDYEAIFSTCLQLCDALEVAHANNILHRDLKPQNVIVGDDGTVKLLDFGIAKDVGTTASATSQALGTVAYMSPEQFKAASQDQRTDIWALGVLLFELLTGTTPFRGNSQAEIMRAIFSQQRPGLRSLGSELPESFERFFDRCLRHDVATRIADMKQLNTELSELRAQLAALHALQNKPEMRAAGSEHSTLGRSSRNERRQITILHFRTLLPGETDPEDQILITDRVKEIFQKIIRRFGAYQFTATSVDSVAYFGYPSAEEQSVIQAVRCALALKEACLRRQDAHSETVFSVQIAVHTGLMITRHQDISPEQALVGDAPSVAQELNYNSSGNQVLISPATEELVRGFFALNEIKTNSGTAFEVLSESTAKSNFDVAVESGLSPFSGRVHELGMLAEAWEQTLDGEPRALAISGEPGIGKSRLVYELKEIIAANPDAWLVECQCSPYETNTSLFPFLNYFQSEVLRFDSQISPAEKNSRIEGLLTEYDFHDEDISVLRDFFAGEIDSASPELIAPEQRQRKIFAGLRRLLSQRAAQQPVLMILEDLHWADPSTNLMIELMLETGIPAGVMLVVTFRSGSKPRWLGAELVTRLALQRLNKKDTEQLIVSLADEVGTNAVLRENLIEKADGNPLFIESLTRTVLDIGPGSIEKIPSSLHASLAARLDHLGDAKIVAQHAAVIGREFNLELLQTCLGSDPEVVKNLVQQLVDHQLLAAPGAGNHSYRFRHALICDAAYDSLLKSDKSKIHGLIADTLGGDPQESPSKLANHYDLAGRHAEAATRWLQAAQLSHQAGAALEAISLCELGLRATDKVSGDTPLLAAIDLALTRGAATIAARGYTHQTVEISYAQALALANRIDSNDKRFAALFGTSTIDIVCGKYQPALGIADQLVTIGKREASDEFLVEAFMVKGLAEFFSGELLSARESFSRTIEIYTRERHGRHAISYGQDPKMIALAHLSWLEFILGNPAVAIETANNAVKHARELNHQFSLTYSLVYLGATLFFAERFDAAGDALEEALDICSRYNIRGVETLALIFRSLNEVAIAPKFDLLQETERLIKTYEATGAKIYLPYWYTEIAFAYSRIEEHERAEKHLIRASEEMEISRETWCEYPLRQMQLNSARMNDNEELVLELTADAHELLLESNCAGWAGQSRFGDSKQQ